MKQPKVPENVKNAYNDLLKRIEDKTDYDYVAVHEAVCTKYKLSNYGANMVSILYDENYPILK